MKLFAVFLALFGLGIILAANGQAGAETFLDNIYLSLTMLAAAVAVVSTLIIGLTALIRQRERAVLVYLITFMSMLACLFLAGEFFGPDH